MSIEIKNLCYSYNAGKKEEKQAIKGINLSIEDASFVVISGPNGSGKTTLAKLLNGLLKPTQGSISSDGTVGILFQVPENQLFEATVLEDVMFGPLNFGRTKQEAREDAIKALKEVGISESLYTRDPFRLSDGQKRLVALAGVLALGCKALVLDEIAAGLDWHAEQRVFKILKNLQRNGMTIIVISHNGEHAALYADKYVYLKDGQIDENAFVHTPVQDFAMRFNAQIASLIQTS